MFKHLLIASMTSALATMSFAKGGRPEDKPKPEKIERIEKVGLVAKAGRPEDNPKPEKKEKVEKVEKVG